MKLKLALIIYIILTLGFLVISQIKQLKSISILESHFDGIEFEAQ